MRSGFSANNLRIDAFSASGSNCTGVVVGKMKGPLSALNPERMFLTHYGAIDAPQEPGERLLTMVDDYVALAKKAAPGDETTLLQRVESAMQSYLFTKARDHGISLSDDALQDALGFDINLNSQGLMVWLQQQKG